MNQARSRAISKARASRRSTGPPPMADALDRSSLPATLGAARGVEGRQADRRAAAHPARRVAVHHPVERRAGLPEEAGADRLRARHAEAIRPAAPAEELLQVDRGAAAHPAHRAAAHRPVDRADRPHPAAGSPRADRGAPPADRADRRHPAAHPVAARRRSIGEPHPAEPADRPHPAAQQEAERRRAEVHAVHPEAQQEAERPLVLPRPYRKRSNPTSCGAPRISVGLAAWYTLPHPPQLPPAGTNPEPPATSHHRR